MSRYRAASLHFIASVFFLFIIFSFVHLVWYPGKLFMAASGGEIMLILLLVDMTIGPLITLVIFNVNKPSLKFDMATVLTFQILFVVYGVWVMFSARPVYMAFVDQRFQLVTANEISSADQKKAKNSEFRKLPLWGPITIGTELPDDKQIVEDMLFTSLSGMGPQNYPEYFVKYDDIRQTVISAALSAEQVKKQEIDEEQKQFLIKYSKENTSKKTKILFVPLITKQKVLYVAIDGQNADILELLEFEE